MKFVNRGDIKFKRAPNDIGIVTYHDACELGRHQGIYESPRDLLKAIPNLIYKDMKYNREDTKCCGGGGLVGAPYPEFRTSQAMRKIFEFIKNGKNGFMIRADSKAALRDAMLNYVKSSELISIHGAQSKKLFDTHFTPAANTERFISTIQGWLNRYKGTIKHTLSD